MRLPGPGPRESDSLGLGLGVDLAILYITLADSSSGALLCVVKRNRKERPKHFGGKRACIASYSEFRVGYSIEMEPFRGELICFYTLQHYFY